MSKPLSSTGSFAWRGQEGSVTDRASGLVYMQARHYDPSIGRFIQADALPVASMTTQGMNRYIYCENDPVNATDPQGTLTFVLAAFAAIAFSVGFFLGAIAATAVFGGPISPLGFGLRGMIGYKLVKPMRLGLATRCQVAFDQKDRMLASLLTRGAISVITYLSLMMRTGLGFIGLAAAVGFAMGFAITSVMLLVSRDENEIDGPLRPLHDEQHPAMALLMLERYQERQEHERTSSLFGPLGIGCSVRRVT